VWKNKLNCTGILFLVALCASCRILQPISPFPQRSVDEVSIRALGEGAHACGTVGYGKEPTGTLDCVFEALDAKQPFYAWFLMRGVDSQPATGLLMNRDGVLSLAWYDRNWSFWGSVYKPTACSTWRVLKGPPRKVICVLAPDKEVYLFEMESFVLIEPPMGPGASSSLLQPPASTGG
jgi:hypothetical protein